MAKKVTKKKDKNNKVVIQQKTYFKKPLKRCDYALDDVARIRNNERAKLSRLNKKFTATKKKTEADKLRREIRAQEKSLENLNGTVKTVRNGCKAIDVIKANKKSLKLQKAQIERKLSKLKGKNYNDAEYKKLNSKFHKISNEVTAQERKLNEILYSVNKELGFKPVDIVKQIPFSKKTLEKDHADDFPDDYFDEIEEKGPSGITTKDQDLIDEIMEEAEAEAEEGGYIEEIHDAFWTVWQDFDKNENSGQNLTKYDKVTFVFNGETSNFKGTSLTLISLKAAEAWRWANSQPPYVYAIKLVTMDGKKLKYELYQQ